VAAVEVAVVGDEAHSVYSFFSLSSFFPLPSGLVVLLPGIGVGWARYSVEIELVLADGDGRCVKQC
jgi:hypothetical protein